MNNLNPLMLATTLLTRAALLEKKLSDMPDDIKSAVAGGIADLNDASRYLQDEIGIKIRVDIIDMDGLVARTVGANPIASGQPVLAEPVVDTAKLDLGNLGQFATGPASPAKKKVVKTPGYGKTSQYVDVPEAFGTSEVSVWGGIVRESAKARAAKLGLSIKREWTTSFKAFLEDMGYKPHPQARMVRKDRTKGYTPRNMTWRVDGEDVVGLANKPNGWGKKT